MIFDLVLIAVAVLAGALLFFGAPYVPSRRRDLKTAFGELYNLGKDDVLVDAGCGDGVVLRAASKYGAKAVGYEINPFLVPVAKILCWRDKNISVRFGDSLRAKWPANTTVVYAFGVEFFMPRLEAKVLAHVAENSKPISVISYGFPIEGKKPAKESGPYFLYKYKCDKINPGNEKQAR